MLALNLLSMVGWFLWFIFGGGIKGLEDSLGKPFRVDVSLVLILFGGVVPPFSVGFFALNGTTEGVYTGFFILVGFCLMYELIKLILLFIK